MHRIPGYCPECKSIFPSLPKEGSGTTTISGATTTCPMCGNRKAKINDGVYTIVDNSLKLVSGPDFSREALEFLQGTVTRKATSATDPKSSSIHSDMYASMMDGIRQRINAIHYMMTQHDKWNSKILEEFCYLQLRMICEELSIACLIAHGNINSVSGVHKKFKPYEIIEKMSELTSNFYPVGVEINTIDAKLVITHSYKEQLKRSDLIHLWGMSGDKLHMKNAKRLLKTFGNTYHVDGNVITSWMQKIINLLEKHIISSPDRKKHYLVQISSGNEGEVSLASVDGDSTFYDRLHVKRSPP